jgi:hypothetical protein
MRKYRLLMHALPYFPKQILSSFQKVHEVQKDEIIWGILANEKRVGNDSVLYISNDIISNLHILWVFPS